LQRRTQRRITLGEQLTVMGLETSALIFLYLQVVTLHALWIQALFW